MKKILSVFLLTGAILLAAAGCNTQAGPTPETAIKNMPTTEPTHPIPDLSSTSASSSAPQVVKYLPDALQQGKSSSAVELVFDQPMLKDSVEKALNIKDAQENLIKGQITWLDESHLRFSPDKPFAQAADYWVSLSTAARSAGQIALEANFSFRFKTQTPLLVSQVIPAEDTSGVKVDDSITVLFNRPVVSLTLSEDQDKLVQPLVISPEVTGHGQWINTSTYTFYPDQPLKSATQYSVSIKAGLKDASGESGMLLPADKSWRFSTLPPILSALQADNNEIDLLHPYIPENISLTPQIKLSFSQAMNKESVQKALGLSDAQKQAIPFRLQWNEDSRLVTLIPLRVLNLESKYSLSLSDLATAQDGGKLDKALNWSFITIPVPGILSTLPEDKADDASSNYFSIVFKSPMRIESILSHLKITPTPGSGRPDYYYDPSGNTFFMYGLQPSTAYSVNIQPGILDAYGNATRENLSLNFSTAAPSPQAYLNMPYQPLYRGDAKQTFFVSSVNVKSLSFKVYKVDPSELIGWKSNEDYVFDPKDLVADFNYSPENNQNGSLEKVEIKTSNGKPLPPGTYFISLDSPDIPHREKFLDSRYFIISDIFLTLKEGPTDTLVWAVNANSGKPVANLPLTLYSINEKRGRDTLGSGETDSNGLLHISHVVSNGLTYVTNSENDRFTFASNNWNSEVSPEDFGIQNIYNGNEFKTLAYLYTDRPLYRPGQPVYFKGILRNDDDLAYQIPGQKEVEVIINSYDKEVYRKTLPVSSSGTFSDQLDLDAEASLGGYTIMAREPDNDNSPYYGVLAFSVAEYRKPEYQVDLSATPNQVLLGGKFSAAVDARYYSGGPLNQANIDWTLRAQPFIYTPPAEFSAYSFSNPNMDDDWFAYNRSLGLTRDIAHGQTTTAADGKASFEVPVEVNDSAESQYLTLETTLTDFSGNQVSSQSYITAHRAQFYPGIRPKQYVGRAAEEQTFNLVVLDWDGKPVAGQNISVSFNERQWYSVQKQDAQGVLRWESSVKDIPINTVNQTSDEKGLASVSFTPEKGGVYRAVASITDSQGRVNRSSTYLWVAGNDYIPWRQSNDRTFQLVTDSSSYQAGDNAEILIASPFQGNAYALVTVERGKIRHEEVLFLTNNSTLYHLPISDDMGPAVYLSVTIVKGIDDTNPIPTYKTALARINVSSQKKMLNVKVTADRQQAGPGETVTYSVLTSDSSGKALPAEVSLSLSDVASLVLADPNSQPIQDFFYGLRGLAVQTILSYSANIDEYNAHLNQMLAEGAGAGSGDKGGDSLGVMAVRQNFPDTAYWNAVVATDEQGRATVKITLPDNLTTWRMDARAVTGDTLVGQTTLDIVSSKDLLVRPQTPRFFIAGDQASVSAAIHNNSKQDLTVTAGLKAEGAQIKSGAEQKINIPAGQQALATWQINIPLNSERVDLVFSAAGGAFSDSAAPTVGTLDHQGLPVYRFEAPETVGSSGEVKAGETRSESILLPDWFDVSQASLKLQIEPSLAAGFTSAYKSLEDYPYESSDMDISRFLPQAAMLRALKANGQSETQMEEKFNKSVNGTLQRIYNRQNSDGGWGWWSGGLSDPLTSAYVLLGLAEAQDDHFDVDANIIESGKTYLQNTLKDLQNDRKISLEARRNRQAFFAYVLARHAGYQFSLTNTLYEERANLSVYAKAFLAQSLWMQNDQDERLSNLLSDINQAATLSAGGASWQEKQADTWNWNTDIRSTAIVLYTLLKVDPQNELIPNGVRWLMAHRSNGYWYTSQETTWSLMSLAQWLEISGELKGNYAYAVSLNNKSLSEGQVTRDNLQEIRSINVDIQDLLKDQVNKLLLARSSGDGRLYYSTYLTVNLPVSEIQPLDQGLSLSRRYYRSSDPKTDVTSAKQGEILEAELSIEVGNNLHYVMISDPLPAGMEAVDASLKTNPQGSQPELVDLNSINNEGWGWWFFTHTDLRDEKVVLFADSLPAGKYVYHYRVRAVNPGTFQVIPPTGQEVYFPDVYGRGAGSQFTIQ
ncbi:MAG: Ig-like domain-containing protein [Anaerolineae bacterium]|nr:Ig-like domain-containing protein [Anaerolineae bacterium]